MTMKNTQAAPSGLFALLLAVLLVAAGLVPMLSQARLKPAPVVLPVTELPQRTPDPREAHPAHQAIIANPIHDPDNPDLTRLQTMFEATRELPQDEIGFPDWMRALREGKIAPRSGVRGEGQMNLLDLDVIMRNTKEMPFVRFPHLSHTQWLDCSNCHPVPFSPQRGVNRITMSDIFRGQYCGMCHDRVAFITFFSCNRCHSVPQDAAAKPANAK
jgi:c(7)-type cytochrome triheme protein